MTLYSFLLGKEVTINEKEGEVTNLLGNGYEVRFYDINHGRTYIDSKDIKNYLKPSDVISCINYETAEDEVDFELREARTKKAQDLLKTTSYDEMSEEQLKIVAEYETEVWKLKIDELLLKGETITDERIHDWWQDYLFSNETEENLIAYVNEHKTDALISKVKRLDSETPNGYMQDSNTILKDIMDKADFEITGISQSIFNIYTKSSDKEAVKQMFFEFTGIGFKDYLEKCIQEITR